jgi:hypothetical protein
VIYRKVPAKIENATASESQANASQTAAQKQATTA